MCGWCDAFSLISEDIPGPWVKPEGEHGKVVIRKAHDLLDELLTVLFCLQHPGKPMSAMEKDQYVARINRGLTVLCCAFGAVELLEFKPKVNKRRRKS